MQEVTVVFCKLKFGLSEKHTKFEKMVGQTWCWTFDNGPLFEFWWINGVKKNQRRDAEMVGAENSSSRVGTL